VAVFVLRPVERYTVHEGDRIIRCAKLEGKPMMLEEVQRCSRCDQWKPVERFKLCRRNTKKRGEVAYRLGVCKKCCNTANNKQRKQRQGYLEPRADLQYVCQQCGKDYHAKSRERDKFCSRACYQQYRRENGAPKGSAVHDLQNPSVTALLARVGKLCEKIIEEASKRWRQCEACGNTFTAAALTAKVCESCRTSTVRRDMKYGPPTCQMCGEVFDRWAGSGYRTMFCERCDAAGKRAQRHKHWHIRRARLAEVESERVDPYGIFKRDRWRCQICGRKVQTQKKNNHPRQATIDHIVPISRGGPHVSSNLQTACRQCNSRKGAKVGGSQLWLL
jgi:hypothetical protein